MVISHNHRGRGDMIQTVQEPKAKSTGPALPRSFGANYKIAEYGSGPGATKALSIENILFYDSRRLLEPDFMKTQEAEHKSMVDLLGNEAASQMNRACSMNEGTANIEKCLRFFPEMAGRCIVALTKAVMAPILWLNGHWSLGSMLAKSLKRAELDMISYGNMKTIISRDARLFYGTVRKSLDEFDKDKRYLGFAESILESIGKLESAYSRLEDASGRRIRAIQGRIELMYPGWKARGKEPYNPASTD